MGYIYIYIYIYMYVHYHLYIQHKTGARLGHRADADEGPGREEPGCRRRAAGGNYVMYVIRYNEHILFLNCIICYYV